MELPERLRTRFDRSIAFLWIVLSLPERLSISSHTNTQKEWKIEMTILRYSEAVPSLTTDQMIEVDRAMVEDFRIDLIQMMENAGRNLASLARERFLDNHPVGKHVVVLAGTGGNGGGALVAARRLHNWGAQVRIFLTRPDNGFTHVSGHQLDIVRRMHVPVFQAETVQTVEPPDLIVDGIIGYSLKGAPRDAAGVLIEWANSQQSPILALDVPSGIDTTTGTVFHPAINATATMTLALPKEGLRVQDVHAHVGELYLADISVPGSLYKEALGFLVGPLFAQSDIIRLEPTPSG